MRIHTRVRAGNTLGAAAALIVACGLGNSAFAESSDVKIARAMSAAPSDISENATIMDVDGTILREGSNNGYACQVSDLFQATSTRCAMILFG